MRILHVAESVKGGCGTYLNQIVPCQLTDPETSDLRVIVPESHRGQMEAIPPDILRCFASNGRSISAMAALSRTLRAEVRDFRPDVVHLHSSFAGLVGRIMLRTIPARPRIIYCAHGWGFDIQGSTARQKIAAAVERVLAPFADTIVAISDYERQRGIDIGIAPRRIVTVANGLADLPPPPSRVTREGPRHMLFVGRLDKQKGFDTLIEAVRSLGDKIALGVVGASVVGDQSAIGKLPDNVSLLGWMNEAQIQQELAKAALVVVPSRWEGFGLVALEAMRAGRAVIASDVGGLPEVVDNGVTGLLLPPEDPAALRSALIETSEDQLAAMGAAGRARFLDRFTIDRTVGELKALYRAVQ
jgi:glycosyltransferase involved in cell wall biosynthesis